MFWQQAHVTGQPYFPNVVSIIVWITIIQNKRTPQSQNKQWRSRIIEYFALFHSHNSAYSHICLSGSAAPQVAITFEINTAQNTTTKKSCPKNTSIPRVGRASMTLQKWSKAFSNKTVSFISRAWREQILFNFKDLLPHSSGIDMQPWTQSTY